MKRLKHLFLDFYEFSDAHFKQFWLTSIRLLCQLWSSVYKAARLSIHGIQSTYIRAQNRLRKPLSVVVLVYQRKCDLFNK